MTSRMALLVLRKLLSKEILGKEESTALYVAIDAIKTLHEMAESWYCPEE